LTQRKNKKERLAKRNSYERLTPKGVTPQVLVPLVYGAANKCQNKTFIQ
jgi:hypothetical protein